MQRLLDHPAVLFTLLGETLPKVCGFFCDYVIIRAFTGLSMELVRAYKSLPWLLGIITCKKKWARSPYEYVMEVCFNDNLYLCLSALGGVVVVVCRGFVSTCYLCFKLRIRWSFCRSESETMSSR